MFNLNRFITVVLVLVGSLTAMAYNVGTGNFFWAFHFPTRLQ
jgi:hypothetical protein